MDAVVGGVASCGVCMAGAGSCSSFACGGVHVPTFCWLGDCIWVGLPFLVAYLCGLLAVIVLVWGVFCCSAGLVMAAAWCWAGVVGGGIGDWALFWFCTVGVLV
ncbi:hypothetical protein ILYODFUR_027652 [Ilyodon furcidens]|uniref:NADH dehydrogenase subunit 6 n=1 Tax=Ilyodon furcidens TaxID=33524 RepID=A0ABV0TFJ1_9TELE